MKLLVVAVALLVVAVNVDADCTPLEQVKVKHQWYEAYGTGHARLILGLKLWNKLFHDHPETRALFSNVHGDDTYSPDFEAHSQRVLSGLDNCISLLDDPDTLAAELAHLKVQHADRNVAAEYYDMFIEELLEVLPDYLGPNLDYGAWNHCLHVITAGIKS